MNRIAVHPPHFQFTLLNYLVSAYVARHEAAHAVTSYLYRVPSVLIKFGGATDHAGEWHADDPAFQAALSYMFFSGKPWSRLLTSLAVVCYAAEVVDIHVNGCSQVDAAAQSRKDKEVFDSVVAAIEDMYRRTPGNEAALPAFQQARATFARSGVDTTRQLLQSDYFRRALELVADEMMRRGCLREVEWIEIIERHLGRPANFGPISSLDPAEILLNAHYVWRRCGSTQGDAWRDWFAAERGLCCAKLHDG